MCTHTGKNMINNIKQYSAMSFLLILLGLSLSGCMPGNIKETKSTFDNSIQLTMDPAFVYRHADGFSGSDLRMALFWSSTMASGDLILEAFVDGAHSIPSKKSLHFKIDGELTSLTSIDKLTDIKLQGGNYTHSYISAKNVSSKRYIINATFLQKIINAKDVRIKFDLRNKFVEGVFSDTTASSAKNAFVKFNKKMLGYAK